jgi:hypothetical protein
VVTVASLLVAAVQTAQELSPESALQELVRPERIGSVLRAAAMVLVGFPLLFAVAGWTRRTIASRYTAQQGLIAGKLVLYAGATFLAVSILSHQVFSKALRPLNSPAPRSHSPPSMVMTSPLIKAEKSDRRYAARLANSWCFPTRPELSATFRCPSNSLRNRNEFLRSARNIRSGIGIERAPVRG